MLEKSQTLNDFLKEQVIQETRIPVGKDQFQIVSHHDLVIGQLPKLEKKFSTSEIEPVPNLQ